MASSIRNTDSSLGDKSALGFILLIPLIWGIGFPVSHNAVLMVDPGLFAFSRSLLALLALLPFALRALRKTERRIVLAGLVLGIFNGLNFLASSIALSQLNSATTAFVVTLNIVFVPFLGLILKTGKISAIDMLAVLLGLLGAYVIFGGQLQHISFGYVWGILSAFAIAVNICVVGKLTADDPKIDRLSLGFYQIFFTTLTLAYFPFTQDLAMLRVPTVWGAIVYQGLFATALVIYLQMKFQHRVGSARTAVIFNLDLVFASLFGLLNKEALSAPQVLGGAIIFLASMLESLGGFLKKPWKRRLAAMRQAQSGPCEAER